MTANITEHDIANGLTLSETDEYDRLVRFFVENRLEYDGDEEVDTDILKSYKVTAGKDHLVGGACLALREGRYIIDGIAVDRALRRMKIGNMLLQAIIGEVKARGGDSIYLVARSPDFFRANGFRAVKPEEAPNFFECRYCPQYKTTCHPQIMKLDIQ